MKHVFIFLPFFISLYASGQAINLLPNGSFENGNASWNHLSGAGNAAYLLQSTDVQDGNQALSINVTALGANPWDVQSIHSGWAGNVGTEYIVSFYAKAAKEGTQLQVVLQKTAYLQQRFTLTTTWKKYEWRFLNSEAGLQLKFQYIQPGAFTLDNVSITTLEPVATTDQLTINPAQKFQVLEGFGGSLAFYTNWVSQHPYKEEIYKHIFDSLGIDILRLRNEYNHGNEFLQSSAPEFVSKANTISPTGVKFFLGSWSPPVGLKSNDSLSNGTLKKENGHFVYNKFGAYWRDALVAYKNIGITPDWISIQNEPDYLTKFWESCKFTPTETVQFPGYDKALDSVYAQIKDLPGTPKICGAEPTGIGNNNFNNYTAPLISKPYVNAYTYHLYNGGTETNPDSYNDALKAVASGSSGKPNFMTEYELNDQSWWKNAWMINNVLTQANATAYLFWDMVWPGTGLIDIDDPWKNKPWRFTKGYRINPQYYAFKHFSKPLSAGHQRVGAANSNNGLRSTAFINKTNDTLITVLINTSPVTITSTIKVDGYNIDNSIIYQSVENDFYKNRGALGLANTISLPDSSVTTIVMGITKDVLGVSPNIIRGIEQVTCMPNPFDNTTQLISTGEFQYIIYNTLGESIETGAGEHAAIVGHKLPPGFYSVKVFKPEATGVAIIVKY